LETVFTPRLLLKAWPGEDSLRIEALPHASATAHNLQLPFFLLIWIQ